MQRAAPFDRSVSAIVPTYNRAGFLGQALDSLLHQHEPPEQIIVVDDGSDDGTAEVAAQYAPRVELIQKPNGGKSSAINAGLKHARGKWVWLFDDDDIALPEASRLLLDALSSHPDRQFAFSGQIVAEDLGTGKLVVRRTILPGLSDDGSLLLALLHGYRFQMQSMLIERTELQRLGGMDERFLRGQDYELTIRLARYLRGVQVNRPTFIWRQHGGERGPRTLRHAAEERSRLWTRFEMMLGEQIRADLALGEYLSPPRKESLAGDAALNDALFNRATVMATKGLIAECVQDLRAVAMAAPPTAALTERQRATVYTTGFAPRFVAQFTDRARPACALFRDLPPTAMMREVQANLARALLSEARRTTRRHAARLRLLRGALTLARNAGIATMLHTLARPRPRLEGTELSLFRRGELVTPDLLRAPRT